MPHVVFAGKVDLDAAWGRFSSRLRHERGWITKITDCFLSSQQRCLLFESTAVFQGVTHNFYVRAEQKGNQVTVRIEPRTNVEKNEGVKWAVTMVGKFLLELFGPQLIVEKSNLPEEMVKALELTHG